jgi:hypothetical protein
MGKAVRAVCIFTPWILTIASFACLVLITIAGWGNKGILNDLYFFKANFTELDIKAPNLPNDDLTAALKYSAESNKLARVYEVHLYNFCERNHAERVVTYCSPKMGDYYFNPITIWSLDSAKTSTMTKEDEIKLLGKVAQKVLDAYRGGARLMFIAYQVSFWATAATILSGILAFCSRFGSVLTWFLSIVGPRLLELKVLLIDHRDTDCFSLHHRRCIYQHSHLHRVRRRHERDPPSLSCSSDGGQASTWARLARRPIRLGWHVFLADHRLLLLRSQQSPSSFEQRRTLVLESKSKWPR